jgi:primosomal protein N' (replication factor Y)
VKRCPGCGAPELEPLGIGTERVQEALSASFPEARVGRMDRDTASGAGVEDLLARMRSHDLDVLVGTQMVTKGHDLPGVTLVGVLLADQGLAFPDFRAGERTFQLLAQVAGRAGRGDLPGRVLLQTYQPHHPSVRFAVRHDYEGFYASELEARRELRYAPFARLVAVRFDAADEDVLARVGQQLLVAAQASAPVADHVVEVLGPAPAPIARLRGRFRARMLLRSSSRPALREVARTLTERIEQGMAPARAHVDIDPVNML